VTSCKHEATPRARRSSVPRQEQATGESAFSAAAWLNRVNERTWPGGIEVSDARLNDTSSLPKKRVSTAAALPPSAACADA
jgi:hypothetical protein